MSRYLRVLLCLAGSLVLLVTSAQGPVCSDGIPIAVKEYEVEMPAQQAIIVWDEDRRHEELILSVELLGSPEAAWVVPVPALPEVETASADWFEMLAIDTKPKIEERIKYVYGNCDIVTVGEQVEVGVELLSREEVGVYDVSILSADEPGALLDWLNDNGYAFPEEGEPILDAYVEEKGWYFVAARVLPGKSDRLDGDVHPLWFSFDTERPIYPMRLTALVESSVDVLIYVLAEHRMEAEPVEFSTEFAGELTLYLSDRFVRHDFSESNTELRGLLDHRTYYVTKLWRSSLSSYLMAEDLSFKRAVSDEPYRAVNYMTLTRCLEEGESPPREGKGEHHVGVLWLGLALVWGGLGVLAVLGLVWRRRSRHKPEGGEDA